MNYEVEFEQKFNLVTELKRICNLSVERLYVEITKGLKTHIHLMIPST